jgi:type II secretory pathway component PulF
MADSKHSSVETPDPSAGTELTEQLAHSKRVQEEALGKIVKVDEQVGEMAKILRKIASAMDRNPTSWDELFLGQERKP